MVNGHPFRSRGMVAKGKKWPLKNSSQICEEVSSLLLNVYMYM